MSWTYPNGLRLKKPMARSYNGPNILRAVPPYPLSNFVVRAISLIKDLLKP